MLKMAILSVGFADIGASDARARRGTDEDGVAGSSNTPTSARRWSRGVPDDPGRLATDAELHQCDERRDASKGSARFRNLPPLGLLAAKDDP